MLRVTPLPPPLASRQGFPWCISCFSADRKMAKVRFPHVCKVFWVRWVKIILPWIVFVMRVSLRFKPKVQASQTMGLWVLTHVALSPIGLSLDLSSYSFSHLSLRKSRSGPCKSPSLAPPILGQSLLYPSFLSCRDAQYLPRYPKLHAVFSTQATVSSEIALWFLFPIIAGIGTLTSWTKCSQIWWWHLKSVIIYG